MHPVNRTHLDSSTVIRTNRDRLKEELTNQQKINDDLKHENSELRKDLNELMQRAVRDNQTHHMEVTKLKLRLQRASETEESMVSVQSNRRKAKKCIGE